MMRSLLDCALSSSAQEFREPAERAALASATIASVIWTIQFVQTMHCAREPPASNPHRPGFSCGQSTRPKKCSANTTAS
jgi:hypothetical protein